MIRFADAEDDQNKVVSALAQVEARSAICRLRRGKAMSPDQATMLLDALAAEMKRMIEQPILPLVLESANVLVERHYLRALDAVQLASAMVSRDSLAASSMRFITADKDLLVAAQKEGFDTWNPCD